MPATADLAAAEFRADLWEEHGWVLWNDAWYSGHTVPGYGLLYPPLGALIGPVAIGVVCALASTALFADIALRTRGERAWLGVVWFGLAATVALWGSRVTFAIGLTLGLAAMALLARGRPGWGALAAALAGLASPVAGLFTALAAAAVFCAARLPALAAPRPALPWRGALALAAAAAVATLALGFAFPTDGYEPFSTGKVLTVVVVALAFLALVPREEAVVRWAAALYLGLVLLEALAQTPLGDNAVRFGYTFAGPVLAIVLLPRRRWALLVVALPLLYWQWFATVNDVSLGIRSDSAEREYHAPLLAELDERTQSGSPIRIHVPPTRTRWEARYVAEEYPLARGWLRQLESDDFEQFHDVELEPDEYAAWLHDHGVAYVAVSDADYDYMAKAELELINRGDATVLDEVWSNDHWRLFEVRGATGLADGGAEVTGLHADGFSVRVPGPGTYLLRLRYTPYFEIDAGEACLEAAGDESTTLTASGPGPQEIEVSADLSLGGLGRRDEVCRD